MKPGLLIVATLMW